MPAHDLVPDWVVDRADDIELIDMAPEALRSRMRHGNIYPPERAARELAGLFRPGNLAALRELALRRTAEEVDGQLVSYMQAHGLTGWLVDERVLVCIDHRPLSQALIRRAWQTAQGLKCPLTAVHVRGARLSQGDRLQLDDSLRQAKELGADVRELDGDDVVTTIARFVTDSRSTQVVVGHRRRSRWHDLMRGSLARALLRQLPDIDIRIVPEGEFRAIPGGR